MRLPIIFATGLALATAACSGSNDATDDSAHPAWLVAAWHTSASDGASSYDESYTFDNGGAGRWSRATAYVDLYGVDLEQHALGWSFEAPDTLVIDGAPHKIEVTRGCTQLKMDGRTWSGSPPAGTCPTDVDALTPLEQTFTGSWTIDRPPADDTFHDTFRGSFTLSEDRKLYLSLYLDYKSSWQSQSISKSGQPWYADDNGDLQVDTDDGPLHLQLSRKGDTLEICYGAFGCFIGHK